MSTSPIVIVENNLSVAWSKAFLKVFEAGEIAPLVVVIEGLNNQDVPEVPSIRSELDFALATDKKAASCEETANTIFPNSLWNPQTDRHSLYARYNKIFPRIRKHRRNRNGVYFQRLIDFGSNGDKHGVNQLEHVISTWRAGNHRRTALQAAIFEPARDHTNQRQRGFPCLQQVAFARTKDDGLAVTGFYAMQYIFGRAYGNYLGLCRLGQFMAYEMELTLSRVTCIATPAKRDKTKQALTLLATRIRQELGGLHT